MSNESSGNPGIHWPAGFTPSSADCFRVTDMVIDAPPARVFAFLADVERWPEWVSDVRHVRILTPVMTRLGPDCSFEFDRDELRFEAMVGEYVPPSRIGWVGIGTGMYFYHTWLLIEVAEGTRVITEEVARGPAATAMRELSPEQVREGHRPWLSDLKNSAEQPSSDQRSF